MSAAISDDSGDENEPANLPPQFQLSRRPSGAVATALSASSVQRSLAERESSTTAILASVETLLEAFHEQHAHDLAALVAQHCSDPTRSPACDPLEYRVRVGQQRSASDLCIAICALANRTPRPPDFRELVQSLLTRHVHPELVVRSVTLHACISDADDAVAVNAREKPTTCRITSLVRDGACSQPSHEIAAATAAAHAQHYIAVVLDLRRLVHAGNGAAAEGGDVDTDVLASLR